MFLPSRALCFIHNDFAASRAVNFNAWGVHPCGNRGAAAEKQGAAATEQDVVRADIIGGIETERLRRASCGDERLCYPIRCPRFLASRFQNERHLQRNSGEPERMHAWGIAGQHRTQRVGFTNVSQRSSCLFAPSPVGIKDAHIQSARQAI